jgi:hypothetical protein
MRTLLAAFTLPSPGSKDLEDTVLMRTATLRLLEGFRKDKTAKPSGAQLIWWRDLSSQLQGTLTGRENLRRVASSEQN